MRRLLTALSVIAALSVVAVLGLASGAQATSGNEDVPAFGNVFVIIGENTDYSQVTKNNSPYLIGTVKPHSAWLTNYRATTHYSEPNYVAMTSGQFTARAQADGSIASCHQHYPDLVHQRDNDYHAGTC